MASEKVLRTNVSLWQKWLKSVKASQCNADGNFWKHLCNNVTVFQCNGVTFNQGWCTTGDKVTGVKSAKNDCTILKPATACRWNWLKVLREMNFAMLSGCTTGGQPVDSWYFVFHLYLYLSFVYSRGCTIGWFLSLSDLGVPGIRSTGLMYVSINICWYPKELVG